MLVAKAERQFPGQIPPVAVCMVHFHALREQFGERIWQKMKTTSRSAKDIRLYEALTYQPYLPKEIIGTSREFCLGYSYSHKKSNSFKETERKIIECQDVLLPYLDKLGLLPDGSFDRYYNKPVFKREKNLG